MSGLQLLCTLVPSPWKVIADQTGYHLLLLSPKFPKAIQREIFVSFAGNALVSVYCVLLPSFVKLFGLDSRQPVPLRVENISEFCAVCVDLVRHCCRYVICVGANDMESRAVWCEINGAYIDNNPYKEESFGETCRSESCLRLLELGGKSVRCKKCAAVMRQIRERKQFLLSPTADLNTSNEKLTKQQAASKLAFQHEEIRKKDLQISYLKRRYQEVLETEGFNLDEDLSKCFSDVLTSSNLNQTQKGFLQEQWSASHKSDSRAHRWHPSMIRFALHLHIVSTAGYEALRDTGLIKLPCARTLYDYSHAIEAKDGINEGLVELVQNAVKEFPEAYKQYHVLLCDGMHISQKLVYRISDGSLVGVTFFDNVGKEMQRLENYVEGKEPIINEPQLATEASAFMVKGIASNVKCLVAAFPCKIVTKEMLYKRSWEVINVCEKSGVKILAYVCDGLAANRAFIEMHSPITKLRSGVVFDTLNFCSDDERPLFFISDVCHLLKTIRNCFYNSGEGEKKTRMLQDNGEKIVWKTIVKLYLTYKNFNFRKSYKLNPQNVFPNPFARMKVRNAAQVLSASVALDLKTQKWPETTETVKFIELCDTFFDVLNGAHTSQSGRHRKPNLAAYTSKDDPRFEWLIGTFLKYLKDWKEQVNHLPLDPSVKEKMMISQQTQTGIEMTINSFIAATKYFLDDKIGGKFLMARVFSQDPHEQEFSKHRAGGGGSRTPNMARFESKMVSLGEEKTWKCDP